MTAPDRGPDPAANVPRPSLVHATQDDSKAFSRRSASPASDPARGELATKQILEASAELEELREGAMGGRGMVGGRVAMPLRFDQLHRPSSGLTSGNKPRVQSSGRATKLAHDEARHDNARLSRVHVAPFARCGRRRNGSRTDAAGRSGSCGRVLRASQGKTRRRRGRGTALTQRLSVKDRRVSSMACVAR